MDTKTALNLAFWVSAAGSVSPKTLSKLMSAKKQVDKIEGHIKKKEEEIRLLKSKLNKYKWKCKWTTKEAK